MLISDLECFEIVEEHDEECGLVAGASIRNILFLDLVGDRLSLTLNGTELIKTDLSKSPRFNYSFSDIPGLNITLQGRYDRSNSGVTSTTIVGRFHNGYFTSSSIATQGLVAARR
jgi:hypothetical protein